MSDLISFIYNAQIYNKSWPLCSTEEKETTTIKVRIRPSIIINCMYNENYMGAKTEPWGTPQVRVATETERPMPTEKVLLLR